MTKKLIIATLLTGNALSMAAEAPVQQPNKEVMMEGVKYIKMLGKELKQNVGKRLKQDPTGVLAAEFCSTNAAKVAREVSGNFPENISVRRTAIKYRNAGNKPDATDTKVMEEMISSMKKGTFKKKPTMLVDDKNITRVYVPLVMEAPCLKCHADPATTDPKVMKIINERYPDDKAMGFKEGDFRGVVVAEISRPKTAESNKTAENNKTAK